jgi:hypothetical protein
LLQVLSPFNLRFPLKDVLEVLFIDVLIFVSRLLTLGLVGKVLRSALDGYAATLLVLARGIPILVFVFFLFDACSTGSCLAPDRASCRAW